ncbi:MAG: GcrA family cell cycle regulator [Flavobacteriaceae bacterium]
MTFHFDWTDERVTRLKQLWSDGNSAGEIATFLGGTTRNAVIGKIHRLGLMKREQPQSAKRRIARQNRPAAPRKSRPERAEAYRAPEHAPERLPTPIIAERAPDYTGEPVPFTETGPRSCKWIFSNAPAMCCGAPVRTGTSWCEKHYRRVYVPAPKKQRKTRERV